VRFFSIAPLFKGVLYSVGSGCGDRPSIGFCNESLLSSKYDGLIENGKIKKGKVVLERS
jgi:hypothetical protein